MYVDFGFDLAEARPSTMRMGSAPATAGTTTRRSSAKCCIPWMRTRSREGGARSALWGVGANMQLDDRLFVAIGTRSKRT